MKVYQRLTPLMEDLVNIDNFYGKWVKLEKHYSKCDCSYCQESLRFIQLRLPKSRKWGWRVIAWKFHHNKYYIRWTGGKVK